MSDDEFDQSESWINRHQRFRGDPRAVGDIGKSLQESPEGEMQFTETVSAIAQTRRRHLLRL